MKHVAFIHKREDMIMRTEIKASGFWAESRPYSTKGRWDINYSDILSRLIQSCGKYCQSYSSDLFIDWTTIVRELEKGENINETYIFGIRTMGVDHRFFYENRMEHPELFGNPDYHEVWELKVKGDVAEKDIDMYLRLIAN